MLEFNINKAQAKAISKAIKLINKKEKHTTREIIKIIKYCERKYKVDIDYRVKLVNNSKNNTCYNINFLITRG